MSDPVVTDDEAASEYSDQGKRMAALRLAFSLLEPAERARLRQHAERGTRILCGEFRNYYWLDGGA